MPPPHSFWVILIGKTPTSFRGKMREDLVPTLRQLQRTQSDVTLRWFERGKIWESPEAAIGAAKLAATAAREKRTREWRPGGEHRDPKARFELTRDQKRAKFKRDQSRPDRPEGERPPRDERPPRHNRPPRNEGRDEQPQSPFGPREPRPDRARSDRPWSDRPKPDRPRPGGSPFGDRGPRPPSRPFGDRPPRGDKRRDRPFGPPAENPFKDRARSDRPAPRPDRPERPGRPDRPDRRPDVRPAGRSDRRPPSSRPGRPGRPPGDRGGFKPPKRRS